MTSAARLPGRLLARGMLLGIASACLMVVFAELFGEPQVAHAIAFEQSMDRAAGLAAEPELVSRATQRGVGLLTGCLMYGAAFGGLFALAFATLHGRIGQETRPLAPRPLAALLALGGFLCVALLPDLKYPPNPPSIGNPDTIGLRTALYFEAILVCLCALTLGVLATRRATARLGAWNAGLLGIAVFLTIAAAATAIMPDLSEVPQGFPAIVLWRFRIASLGMQLVLWSALGLGFGQAASTLLDRSRASR